MRSNFMMWARRWAFALLLGSPALAGLTYAENVAQNTAPNTAAKRPPTILVLGDSLSAGYGIPEGKGWVALLGQKLGTEARPWALVNSSISGDTTTDALARFGASLHQVRPAIVIIELGGNDGLRGKPPAVIRSNLLKLVELAQREHARVLLMEMRLPPNYGKAYIDAFVRNYSDVARSTGATLVPFFLSDIGANKALMQADGIHPNEQAQSLMLAQVWPHLQKQLSTPH